MIMTIVLALAEYLIKYLINKNWELSNDLTEARDRYNQYQKELAQTMDDQRLIQKDIDAVNSRVAQLGYLLNQQNAELEEMRKQHEDNLKKIEKDVSDISDDDILTKHI